MKKIVYLSALSLCASLCSCSTHMADLPVVSSKHINPYGVAQAMTQQGKKVKASDGDLEILFLDFGTPRLQDAIDAALKKGKGDMILDAKVYSTSWWLLIGRSSITVEGRVVNTNASQSN